MTKLRNEKGLRDSFREKLVVDKIAQIEKDDKNYLYKGVIFTYDHDPLRVDRYIDRGWEVVTSTDTLLDDRKNVPDNSKTEKLRPSPVIKTLKKGHQAVLMRIKKTDHNDNKVADLKRDNDRYLKSTNITKMSRTGDTIKMKLDDVTEGNVGDDLNG